MGGLDPVVPWPIANASFRKLKRNAAVTEIGKVPGRATR